MHKLIILLNQMKGSLYTVRYSIVNMSLPQYKEVCKDVIEKNDYSWIGSIAGS